MDDKSTNHELEARELFNGKLRFNFIDASSIAQHKGDHKATPNRTKATLEVFDTLEEKIHFDQDYLSTLELYYLTQDIVRVSTSSRPQEIKPYTSYRDGIIKQEITP